LLKTSLVTSKKSFSGSKPSTISHFKAELDGYLNWFNNDHIKLKLKGLSPVQYRTQSLDSVSLAVD